MPRQGEVWGLEHQGGVGVSPKPWIGLTGVSWLVGGGGGGGGEGVSMSH